MDQDQEPDDGATNDSLSCPNCQQWRQRAEINRVSVEHLVAAQRADREHRRSQRNKRLTLIELTKAYCEALMEQLMEEENESQKTT